MVGRAVGVLESVSSDEKEEYSAHYCSPSGETVRRIYTDGTNLYEESDLFRSVNGVVMTKEVWENQVKATATPKNDLTLTVSATSQIEPYLVHSDAKPYLFEPGKKGGKDKGWDRSNTNNEAMAGALAEALGTKGYSFTTFGQMARKIGWFHVYLRDGKIHIRNLFVPGTLAESDVEYEAPKQDLKRGIKAMLSALCSEFDPYSIEDTQKERVLSAVAQLQKTGVIPAQPKTEDSTNLLELLSVFQDA